MDRHAARQARGLIALCSVAALAGAAAGVVGAAFSWVLLQVEQWRFEAVTSLHQWPAVAWLVPVVGAAIAVAIARMLVVVVPSAAGSGLQRVEASIRGHVTPETLKVVPAKFVGGVLAIGAGLALGREGPTVQMAAAIGSKLARSFRMNKDDQNTMQAALAGTGLGVAFNAPIGGCIFVVEELTKEVRVRLVAATLVAAGIGVGISHLILGDVIDFRVAEMPSPTVGMNLGCVVFGIVVGLVGAQYSKFVIFGLDVFEKFGTIPIWIRAGIVGAVVGLVGWFLPSMVGGGDNLTNGFLVGEYTIAAALGILVIRWFLGPLSYSVGAPGGLFAPLLVLGAACGSIFGTLGHSVLPGVFPSAAGMVLVGMSVMFTAVVRAPITGVVLVAEMTATTSQLIPMLLACGAALVTTTAIKSEPIYDTLRNRMMRRNPNDVLV